MQNIFGIIIKPFPSSLHILPSRPRPVPSLLEPGFVSPRLFDFLYFPGLWKVFLWIQNLLCDVKARDSHNLWKCSRKLKLLKYSDYIIFMVLTKTKRERNFFISFFILPYESYINNVSTPVFFAKVVSL